jgi:hypothetical protein
VKEKEQKPRVRKPKAPKPVIQLSPSRRSSFAMLGDVSLTIEKVRVKLIVREKHLNRRRETCTDTLEILAATREFEEFVDGKLAARLMEHPAWAWVSRIKGCGPENVAKVIARIENFGHFYDPGDPMIPSYVHREPEMYFVLVPEDKEDEVVGDIVDRIDTWLVVEKVGIWVAGIERLTTPSKLRKLAGHMPGMKREVGKKIGYDQTLKMLMWRMGRSLMRAEGKFYGFYSSYKAYLIARETQKGTKIMPTPKARFCPACTKEVIKKAARFCPDCNGPLSLKNEPPGVLYQGHLHAMAKARMQQAFLDSLWAAWREALGLPVCTPYPIQFLGHHDAIHYRDWYEKETAGERGIQIT